jgi:aspartate aminotransferase
MKEGRIAAVQTLSGTGALRVVGEFIVKHLPRAASEIWVSDPTWAVHNAIFEEAGMTVKSYPYWDETSKALNFEGMISALKTATPGCMVCLHACAHNPTGVDPTEEQWIQIADVMQERCLIPLIDSAYQGYASGDLAKDAFSVRLFVQRGFEFFVCQSFAKNLGLYGERIGMLHVVCNTAPQAKAVLSQLKLVIRPMYSSPPRHGAELVTRILDNPQHFEAWKRELKAMADRILEVRGLLRRGLEEKGTPGTWAHITDQIGMFSFTGLSVRQCETLMNQHHIYLLMSGRISMAGLNRTNISYMVECVDKVVRTIKS